MLLQRMVGSVGFVRLFDWCVVIAGVVFLWFFVCLCVFLLALGSWFVVGGSSMLLSSCSCSLGGSVFGSWKKSLISLWFDFNRCLYSFWACLNAGRMFSSQAFSWWDDCSSLVLRGMLNMLCRSIWLTSDCKLYRAVAFASNVVRCCFVPLHFEVLWFMSLRILQILFAWVWKNINNVMLQVDISSGEWELYCL